MITRKQFLLLLLAAFVFRLGFGLLCSKLSDADYKQTYLIGLKVYTTGAWPYFGPDVNGKENDFQSQIPGALEGLLIGTSFRLLPIPEAPFILVNVLSLIGVALLSGYIHRRLPALGFVWLFIWISITPWSLHEGTTIINPAFTFLPAVLFIIGFLESTPYFTLGLLPMAWANVAMGFSLFCVMQLHFSYVYLIPLAAFSLGVQCLRAKRLGSALFFILGAVPPLVLIVPTFLRYGLRTNDVASGFIVPFSFDHVQEGLTILARFLSLVSFEVPLFAGGGVQATVTFLLDHVWILLPGALLCVVGLLQPFLLLFSWFRKDGMDPQWIGMRRLVLAAFFMVYASFWFTVKIPRSHIYFIFFPLLMVYSCHCYLHLKDKYGWRLLAKAILVMGIWFQLGYAIAVAPKWSLYLDRSTIQKAITEKDYKLFGERRPASFY